MSGAVTKAKNYLPAHSDPLLHHTGYAPSTTALCSARESFLHAANYRRSGMLMIAERSTATLNTYHVFFPAMDGTETTCNVFLFIKCHKYYSATTITVTVTDDDATETEHTRTVTVDTTLVDAGYGPIEGETFRIVHPAKIDTSKSYNMLTVEVDGARVGAFSAMMAPEAEQTNESVFWVDPGAFNAGMRLLGYDRVNGQNGSIGSMIQNQNADDTNTRTILSASRPCLWGWCAGNGRYLGTGATEYVDFMVDSFNPYLTPRNLTRGTDARTVDVVIAYRCDDGAKIKLESSVDSYEWTPTANTGAAPVMAILSSGFEIDPMGDQIKISLYRTASIAIEIHAIAIFERSIGAMV